MNYGTDYQGGGTSGDMYGGGGGFNNNSFGGGAAYNGASQDSAGGGGNRRNYDEQTIIPVTARMIASCQTDPTDSNFIKLEDDRKVYHVKIVGAIRECESQSTNNTYTLEDGTGTVDVKQWTDENACAAILEEVQQALGAVHQYVKIVGKVKHYDAKFSIIADTIKPLSTGNELAHHFLEVVYSGEKYKHSDTIVQPNSPTMGVNHNNMTPGSMGMGGAGGGVGFGGGNSGGRGRTPVMQQSGGGGGDLVQQAVMEFVRRHADTEIGANIHDCIRSLPQYSQTEIRSVVENLQSEGLLYSTVDEDHFKAAM